MSTLSINQYYSDITDMLLLPANGIPLTFKKYVKWYKINNGIFYDEEYEKLLHILDNKNVAEVCYVIEHKKNKNIDFLSLSFPELTLYFSYLHAMNVRKMDVVSKHCAWISNNISFEDLYKIKDKGINLNIKHDGIISKQGNSILHLLF